MSLLGNDNVVKNIQCNYDHYSYNHTHIKQNVTVVSAIAQFMLVEEELCVTKRKKLKSFINKLLFVNNLLMSSQNIYKTKRNKLFCRVTRSKRLHL